MLGLTRALRERLGGRAVACQERDRDPYANGGAKVDHGSGGTVPLGVQSGRGRNPTVSDLPVRTVA